MGVGCGTEGRNSGGVIAGQRKLSCSLIYPESSKESSVY